MDPWRFSTRGIAWRLFFTCWIVYALHFATNIVREIYLAVPLGDHCAFRVDEYAGLHPDLFEKNGYGWHINNNPGASMIASLPYFLNRVWIDPVVDRVRNSRALPGWRVHHIMILPGLWRASSMRKRGSAGSTSSWD